MIVSVEKDKSTAVQNRSRSIPFASSHWKNSKIHYIDLKFVVRPGARSGALSDRAQPTQRANGRSSQVVGMMYQD